MWRNPGRVASAASLALVLLSTGAALADRRDTKAADLYDEGRRLIQKGKHTEGARLLVEALKRGATEPCELQGDSRFGVRQYDPYYWLGVAQMEMGLDEQALANFTKSETIVPDGESRAVITKWKKEYDDLRQRKAILLARLAPPTPAPPPPTATAAAIPPSPTSAPVLPAATPTVLRVLIPTIAPTPTVPGDTPYQSALRDRRALYAALSADPAVGGTAAPLLASRASALSAALGAKLPRPEADWKKLEERERAAFQKDVVPALFRAALTAGLDALSKRRWDEAVRLSELARKLDPKAQQPDVLACAALASRYLLEQRKDPTLIQGARGYLRAWQEKTGRKDQPVFLSPSLREALR